MDSSNFLQVAFFPYAPIKNDIILGDITFWNYATHKKRYITDSQVIQHLDKILSSHVDCDGHRQLDTIVIASIGKTDFRQFKQDEEEQLIEAKYILAFLFIDKNESLSRCTSDNFELYYQNFNVNNDRIFVKSGGIYPVISGEADFSNMPFIKPAWVNIPMRKDNYEPKLLSAMQTFWNNRARDNDSPAMLRSLQWFYEAYRNSENVSHYTRILLMAAAFETLLGLKKKKRLDFVKKINKLLGSPADKKTETISYEGKPQCVTPKQKWADTFYNLRNAIIHGDKVPIQDLLYRNGKRHFDIAILFFKECFKRKLNLKGWYKSDIIRFVDKSVYDKSYKKDVEQRIDQAIS